MPDTLNPVAALEQRRWRAPVAGGLEEQGRLFADDLTSTHSNGLVDSMQSYLAALRDGVFRCAGIDLDWPTSRGCTAVWAGREGERRVEAWHSCPVPA